MDPNDTPASQPGYYNLILQHLDQYAPLAHKFVLDPNYGQATGAGIAPSWVPRHERRRLTAYKVLAAYRLNAARAFLRGASLSEQLDHREYGDAALLVDRVVAGVLGDTVTVMVDGAAASPPDVPDLPPYPDPLADDATPIDKRIYDIRIARWNADADQVVGDWQQQWVDYPALLERQRVLRKWADDEQLTAKLDEQEHDSVGLGDGVLVLAWSATQQRPTLSVFDPGFYFPVITDTTDGYPTKVHMAWEFEDDAHVRWVRRQTWSLEPIADGTTRPYPWDDDGDTKTQSELTCYFTDGRWPIGNIDVGAVADFPEAGGIFAVTDDGSVANRLDLQLDFIPVLHIPNTAAFKEHYGQAMLSIVAQVLDDLAAADTDVRHASDLAAGPAIALAGAQIADGDLQVRPGEVFQLGATGSMHVLDLTTGLVQLAAGVETLQKRLSQNAKVPEELLGRISSAKAISGVAMALAFGPFSQYVQTLRLVREPKLRLLLKMVQRMYQAAGVLDPGVNPVAHVALGSYLPADRDAVATSVVSLLTAKAISRQTAVQLLVAVGFKVADAAHEVDRIEHDDTAGAKNVADATGSEQVAADWLGVELPQMPAPAFTLPRPGEPPAPTTPAAPVKP